MKIPPLSILIISIFFSSLLQASEEDMQRILKQWDKQVESYLTKLNQAQDEESRTEALRQVPKPDSIARALWNTTSARSGERRITLPRTELEKRQGRPARTRNIPRYQYEEKWAAPAIAWWITYPDSLNSVIEEQQLPRIRKALIESVQKTHYRHPAIAGACAALAATSEQESLELLQNIHQRNPDKNARALAALALSIILDNNDIRILEGNDESIRAKQIYYIRFALQNALQNTNYGHYKLDAVAMEQLYKINKLSIGRTPPQFTVHNLKGQKRSMPTANQAYILFFWDPSERLSRNIIDNALALQKNYPEIRICPITTGYNAEGLIKIMKERGFKGGRGVELYLDSTGASGKAYRIRTVPTAALISHRGTLLYLGYPDLKLQSAINNYMDEVRRDKAAFQRKNPASTQSSNRNLNPSKKPSQRTNKEEKSPTKAGAELPALRPLPQF